MHFRVLQLCVLTFFVKNAHPASDSDLHLLRTAVLELKEQVESLQAEELRTNLREIKQQLNVIQQQLLSRSDQRETGEEIDPTTTEPSLTQELDLTDADIPPSNCRDVQKQGQNVSGVYELKPKFADEYFSVWCDMETRGGGWISVLRRFDGSENFNLNWTDYKNGFGKLSGEHWLGLEYLYHLTNESTTEVLFELVDQDSNQVYALYDNFSIGSESEDYFLKSFGEYSGDAGDAMSKHLNRKFMTPDHQVKDNTCATYFESGWWFDDCYNVLLTGKYIKEYNPHVQYSSLSAIQWETFHGYDYVLKGARMLIRPIDV